MKNSGTTKVIRDPGSPPVATDTDWAAVNAMSDAEIHQAALADEDAQPFPDQGTAGLTKLVNVKKLRERLGQTQDVAAKRRLTALSTPPSAGAMGSCPKGETN